MNELKLTVDKTGDGRTVVTLNGKVYTLLAGYQHHRTDGWFFLAVAGRTPLKADDLAEHWQVVKSGAVTFALAQRPFSYHLAMGEETEPPYGCDWPRLKAPPGYYGLVQK